jgi:hypothetical protein
MGVIARESWFLRGSMPCAVGSGEDVFWDKILVGTGRVAGVVWGRFLSG